MTAAWFPYFTSERWGVRRSILKSVRTWQAAIEPNQAAILLFRHIIIIKPGRHRTATADAVHPCKKGRERVAKQLEEEPIQQRWRRRVVLRHHEVERSERQGRSRHQSLSMTTCTKAGLQRLGRDDRCRLLHRQQEEIYI
jgi:hypothetical protein